jgi:hypothetical protein
MPQGGYRPGSGRRSKWNHEPTVTIRIPEVFKAKVLEFAHSLDDDTFKGFVTKSKRSVTKSNSPVASSDGSVTKSNGYVTESNSRYLTTRDAHALAASRGCQRSYAGFRQWAKRNPADCEQLYSLRVLERDSGDRNKNAPSYEDLLFSND